MDRKDAMNIVLDLTEKQMRVALVEMVFTVFSRDPLNKYDFEAILDIARTHGQK